MNAITDEINNIISTLPESGSTQTPTRTTKQTVANIQKHRVPLSSLSKEEKQTKIDEITPATLNLGQKGKSAGVKAAVLLCKFIQCMLWDVGFKYVLLNYQYDAVLAAAGIDVMGLLDTFVRWDDEERSLLVSLCEMGEKARIALCRDNVSFVKTGGLLLAGKFRIHMLCSFLPYANQLN